MKLKYEFIINKVADKNVAVPVGDAMTNFSGFLKMNDVGAYIFNMLKTDVTEDDIVSAIAKEYSGATETEIRATVQDFTNKLKENGLVE
ncbi:MAG: PqqD family protein [Ruminococcaceae bacterium]|nr:PqqD family protein [Oscillospiraceae bacterium]